MSTPGRPKGEYRKAKPEGTPTSTPGRPKGEHRKAKPEGTPTSAPGRPKRAYRRAQPEGTAAPTPENAAPGEPARWPEVERRKAAREGERVGDASARREVVLITGISGSGKSVALHALEDAGFFCVDNLPPEMLREFIRLEHSRFTHRVAVAVDVRNAVSLPQLVPLIQELQAEGVHIRALFLDAGTDALVRRFSETRRPHPLSAQAGGGNASQLLVDAIEMERDLLAALREVSTVVDTSQLRPAQLSVWVRDLVGARGSALTLVFESFAFKYGVPLDADFVFDVRMLPNPHYIRELRPMDGRDAAVAAYLDAQPDAAEMLAMIETFLRRWIGAFEDNQRSYLTVAIGCTGGQHRSVYLTQTLARRFADRGTALVRHRELDARE